MTNRMIAAVMLFVFMMGGTALAAANPEENKPDYWGDNCFKIEWEGDVRQYTADSNYSLIVIKAGTVNYEFRSVTKGDVLEVPKGISHIIFCEQEEPPSTTTTILPTTTTSEPQSTTSTSPPSTVVSSTTVTVGSETTTTLQTTTSLSETSTTETPPTTVTASTLSELPYTGSNTWMAGVGAFLILVGATAIVAFRGIEDDIELES